MYLIKFLQTKDEKVNNIFNKKRKNDSNIEI